MINVDVPREASASRSWIACSVALSSDNVASSKMTTEYRVVVRSLALDGEFPSGRDLKHCL